MLQTFIKMIIILNMLLLALLTIPALAFSSEPPELLPTLEIKGTRARDDRPAEASEKGESRIHRGKKTSQTPLTERPALTDQSARQALSDVSGLNVSEVSNQSFTSLSFRGLGDPHEGYHVQTLEDGIPISADPYGYPANYYAPPHQALDSLEYYRGGSSLLFGPQPGGALNYRTRILTPGDRLQLHTQQSLGSYGFFSSFNQVTAPVGDIGLRGTYLRRQGAGFRQSNQDFGVDYAQVKAARAWGSTLLTLKLDTYAGDHGEPGGLARTSSDGVRGIDEGITATTLANDRLRIRRTGWLLLADTELGANLSMTNRFFGATYNRFSRRQNLGTAPVFGGVPNAETNTLQEQDFLNFGLESRLLRTFENGARWSVGLFGFTSASTFDQATGATVSSETGTATRAFDRSSRAVSLFTEVETTIAGWRLVPGLRIEGIHQRVEETLNAASPETLRTQQDTTWVPLLGLGIERDLGRGVESYTNVSQGYRPIFFADAVPLAPGSSISEDLRPANSWSAETGLRQALSRETHWDTSVFYIQYDNQFGRSGNVLINTGAARHFGADLTASQAMPWGLIAHGNVTWLNARFIEGPQEGLIPQYAPTFLGRIRLEQRIGDRFRWNVIGTLATRQFGDDTNTADQTIPGYGVWDFLAEADLVPGKITAMASIQNLFNKAYWSRVRANGIDPGAPFTIQGGLRVIW
jgi:Fe(3+) dicitrate transport protein